MRSSLVVIDPAVKVAEVRVLNALARRSSLPLSYHLPGLFGLQSLQDLREPVGGIIILGSLSSVHDNLPWQKALEDWIDPHFESEVPVLGLCFGHQFLAHRFGGSVGYVKPDRSKLVGVRRVRLDPDPLWDNRPQDGYLCVSHCEMVTDIPNSMTGIGTSDEVPVEALRHRKLPIWSFQSHPEACSGFLSVRGVKDVGLETKALTFGWSLMERFLSEVERHNSEKA